ncbi:hypothetical protein H6796_02565 [Candidatus Nomurabacteria bacterium]|nr:hypothetical protein [Candidatus Nomurabacteria bacterium]
MVDGLLLIFLLAILIVGVMVFAIVSLTKHAGKNLNKEKYQSRWLTIENSLKKNEPTSYQMSVLAADKLLDHALKERGFRGKTMGERMKAANSEFKNANHVWSAHKIRNKIAHEPDAKVSYDLATRSLQAFKQALKDVRAI